MKIRFHSILVPAILAASVVSAAAQTAPPALLHLQARLTDAIGNPLQGIVSLEVRVYAAASGGAPLWFESESPTALNGVVSLLLGDSTALPANLFSATERWLALKVGADAEMFPRLRIASEPYALRSGGVAALDASTTIPTGLIGSQHIADGAIGAADLGTSSVTTTKLADAAVTTTKLVASSVGSSAIASGAVDGSKIADGSITNADVSGVAAIAGTKIAPNFGSQTLLTLGSAGIGTATPQARLDVQAASGVGVWGESPLDVGILGKAHAGFGPLGLPPVAGVFGTNDGGGDGVQGYTSTGSGAGVRGYTFSASAYGGSFANPNGTALSALGPTGVRGESASSSGDAVYGKATAGNGSAWGVRGESSSVSGIGVRGDALETIGTNYGVYGQTNSASGFGGYFRNVAAGVGAYVEGKGKTASNAALRVYNPEPVQGMAGLFTNASNYHTMHLENTGTGGVLWLKNAGSDTFITAVDETGDWKFWVDQNGKTSTKVLQILGGSDLSEGFDVATSPEAGAPVAEPGMVVCIDPDKAGKLALSRRAYDTMVAGVISGAGGVQPGMIMGQAGTIADGEHPVALSGRVYCRCDARSGPIRPGDLLTSSDTPGHAMKVLEHGRAQGAVIGKAMSALDEGTGLVLILVGLQ